MPKNRWGLIVGSFIAGIHLLWVILIAAGVAQAVLDFIYYLHSLNNPFTIQPFELVKSVGLVVFTFVVGYIAGWVIAFLWEKMPPKK
jgi:heme/copper-type cytochrome/quinol oxidase subunit 4